MDTANSIGIVGLSYCGSTMLNYILDTHSEIYGGSELRRLIEHGLAARCAICGLDCPVLTSELKTQASSYEELYRTLRSQFDVEVIADASKTLGHFTKLVNADGSARFALVVLTKHPIRHIASYFTNNKRELPEGASENDVAAFIDEIIGRMEDFYDGVDRRLTSIADGGMTIRIAYEDVVVDPEREIEKILELCGLLYENSMAYFDEFPHHPVGGNRGPAVQTARFQGRRVSWGAKAAYRRKFYEGSRGLMLDDKYREAFSEEDVKSLGRRQGVKRLADRLGYDAYP